MPAFGSALFPGLLTGVTCEEEREASKIAMPLNFHQITPSPVVFHFILAV